LGIATTIVLALVIIGFLGMVLANLPDLARYLRLRRM
jgi:hypothetical protein